MSATAAAIAGQQAAEALMVDDCTITSAAGVPVFDEATGTYTAAAGSAIYTGPCKVRPSNLSANTTVDAGERRVSLWPFVVSVPVTVTGVELDHIVTVTASLDPSMVGLTLRVRSVARGTYLTARRLDCEEVSS